MEVYLGGTLRGTSAVSATSPSAATLLTRMGTNNINLHERLLPPFGMISRSSYTVNLKPSLILAEKSALITTAILRLDVCDSCVTKLLQATLSRRPHAQQRRRFNSSAIKRAKPNSFLESQIMSASPPKPKKAQEPRPSSRSACPQLFYRTLPLTCNQRRPRIP